MTSAADNSKLYDLVVELERAMGTKASSECSPAGTPEPMAAP